LAARFASVRPGITAQVQCVLFSGGIPPFKIGRKVTTYGTKSDNARGQVITMAADGGTAIVNEMTDSTLEDHFVFLPGFQPAIDTTLSNHGYMNIGIGVGDSPERRLGTWLYLKDTGESVCGPIPCIPAFSNVPAGSRLSILAGGYGSNDTSYDAHIYAVS
jgi:hypothetical protein